MEAQQIRTICAISTSFSPSPMAITLLGWMSRMSSSRRSPSPLDAPRGKICNRQEANEQAMPGTRQGCCWSP